MRCLVLLLLFWAPLLYAQTYTTTFNHIENPISDGRKWISGKSTGLDWSDVQSYGAGALGVFNSPSGSNFADPTAVLSGTWGPTQDAKATVKVASALKNNGTEVEIRVRTTITAHSITGYEINCSAVSFNPYIYPIYILFAGMDRLEISLPWRVILRFTASREMFWKRLQMAARSLRL
jgi:hypothetical protein